MAEPWRPTGDPYAIGAQGARRVLVRANRLVTFCNEGTSANLATAMKYVFTAHPERQSVLPR
jgi:hypothetical protein